MCKSIHSVVSGLIVSVGTVLILTSGCGKESPTKPVVIPPPSVASVVVSPTSAKLRVGGTQRFTATARTSDGSSVSGTTITWTSSNTAVVSINAQGLATAVGVGTAIIRAVADGITSAPVTVTVAAPPIASVTVNPSSPQQLTVGGTRMFAVTARTADGSTRDDVEVSWTSSNTAVVTIDSKGLATAVGIGMAIIRAVADGVTSSPVTITVTAPPIASVTVNPSAPQQLMVGSTRMFAATARTSDESTRDDVEVSWTSSNTAVVSIDSTGLATAVGTGMAIIRAVADGVTSAPVMITVIAPQVDSVTVSPSSPQQLTVGEFRIFAATVRTTDGSTLEGAPVTWTSSNTAVMTIDESGLATAVDVGTAMIRAVSGGVTSEPVMITVEAPPVMTVTVTPVMASIEEGESQQFEAVVTRSDGMVVTDAMVSWASSNEMVASIDQSGLATGVSAGEATITATADGVSGMATLTVTEPPPQMIASITVNPTSMMFEVGGTFQFEATAWTSDGMMIPDVSFAWSSDDTGVATVDDTGLVTATGAGTAMITAMADGVTSMPATVTVLETPPEIDNITVDMPTLMFEVGDTHQLTAVARTSEGTMIGGIQFMWSSDNIDVATVDQTGLVTAIGAGTANITATADGIISEPVMIMVSEPPPVVDTITVSPGTASIREGSMQQFTAIAYTSDNMEISDVTFTWMSSDESVATIDSTGLASGEAAGSTTISATADGVAGSATLAVTEPPPPPPTIASISVSPSNATIEEGDTQRFSATARTSGGRVISGVSFTWTSSRESVATISSSGLARGVSAGSTTIRASAGGRSGTASLTVTEPPPPPQVVDRVTVDPSSATIDEGGTRQFVATAFTADNDDIVNASFTWESSNESVATISASGQATGARAGSSPIQVTITATADGKSGTATLTVRPAVSRVSVSPSSRSIEVGDTQLFSATAYTSYNVAIQGVAVSWTSNRASVATINSSSGRAMAVTAGTATITATGGGRSGTAMLTVTEPPPPPPTVNSVSVSPSSDSIEEGETQRFTATAYDSDNGVISGKTFTWTSSMTSVATLNPSSGLATTATGVNAGSTTIRATVDGVSGSANLTVTTPPPPPPPPTLKSRTGSISGWSGYTSAAGSVTFSEIAGGRLKLEITGLNDGNAPDAWLALYTSSRIDWDAGASLPDGARGFGEVTNQSSFSRTFTPRSGETIDSYSHVVLHCRAFKVGIARASLSN